MKKLIIMRGLPGGGKSTQVLVESFAFMKAGARSIAVCSTDDQFLDEDGVYIFDPTRLGVNHLNNQVKCQRMMNAGIEVIFIDNTNTTHKEMVPYKELASTHGYEVTELVIDGDILFSDDDGNKITNYIDLCTQRNSHGVPREAILRMYKRFER